MDRESRQVLYPYFRNGQLIWIVVSRLDTARMPWHDIHSMVAGPIVMDISQHFVERWNFVRELKYDHDPRYEHLAFPHNPGENDDPAEAILDHPHFRLWGDSGKKVRFAHDCCSYS